MTIEKAFFLSYSTRFQLQRLNASQSNTACCFFFFQTKSTVEFIFEDVIICRIGCLLRLRISFSNDSDVCFILNSLCCCFGHSSSRKPSAGSGPRKSAAYALAVCKTIYLLCSCKFLSPCTLHFANDNLFQGRSAYKLLEANWLCEFGCKFRREKMHY